MGFYFPPQTIITGITKSLVEYIQNFQIPGFFPSVAGNPIIDLWDSPFAQYGTCAGAKRAILQPFHHDMPKKKYA